MLQKFFQIFILLCCGQMLYGKALSVQCDSVKQLSNRPGNYEQAHKSKYDLLGIENYIEAAANTCNQADVLADYYDLAAYFYVTGDFEKCFRVSQKVIDLSDKDSTGVYFNMYAYNLMANIKGIQNHYNESLRLFGIAK